MLGFLDNLLASVFLALKQPVESFIRLETADDENTLIADDGSLVSIIKIDGARQIIGDTEYANIVEQATVKLGARFDRPGYALQVYFMRDPERIRPELERLVKSSRSAATAMGLELEDLFSERVRVLERWLAWEELYMVCWTRPNALSKTENARATKDAQGRKWVVARDAQNPLRVLTQLRARHKSFVSGVETALNELGIQAGIMEVHAALRSVRNSLYPGLSNDNWRASLPGDPLSAREPQRENDASDILWPPLRRQLAKADGEVLSSSSVRLGNQIWSGLDMTLGPMDSTPFPILLNRLAENDIPFRISFLMESGGIEGAAVRKFLTAVMGFSSAVNKQIKQSLDALQDLARDEAVIRLRVSLATWAHKDDPQLLEDRTASLMQATESWGYCQVSQTSGDPLEAVLSSALGISCSSTAPAGVAPLVEVIKLLPWQRASSPFEQGSILFRTPDGRVWPYQTGSTLTTTWFDLIFAQPGAGKSVLMNAMNLGTILTPGVARLPYIAVIDIGPSSSGLISLIRDALPMERRHEAVHFRLRMTPDYAVNPFDTQLGCRYPLPDERSYLVELLTLLCTPAGQEMPYDGIPQLVALVVDEMYRWRDDSGANAEPRPYLPNIDRQVDEVLLQHRIQLPEEPYWWDVVDGLFERGLIHEATLAQRHASPTLSDAVTASRRPQIRNLLAETTIGASAEGVLHAFERMIAAGLREFPILASITRFDIGSARICAIDLGEVAPQGDENADRQTAIMYMLARHTMVRSWWLGEDVLKMIPLKFRAYHDQRVRDIRETPKRICYDEFHRTSRAGAVRSQVVRDVREGRKWGVQIVLASQLLDDFDDNMVDLATGVWILGSAVSEGAVKNSADRFGLSETAVWLMRHRLTGPRSSGAPALLVLGTNEGRYEQFLINTLGPIELWALSTSAEDMVLRSRLYERIGAARARQILAANFPGGSARNDIRRRVLAKVEAGEIEAGATSAVIAELVEELIGRATGNVAMEPVTPARQAAPKRPAQVEGPRKPTVALDKSEDAEAAAE